MIDSEIVLHGEEVTYIKISEVDWSRVLSDEFPFASLLDQLAQNWDNDDEYLECSHFWYKARQSHDHYVRVLDREFVFKQLRDDTRKTYTIALRTYNRSVNLTPYQDSMDCENCSQKYFDLIDSHREREEHTRGARSESHHAAQAVSVANQRQRQPRWEHNRTSQYR